MNERSVILAFLRRAEGSSDLASIFDAWCEGHVPDLRVHVGLRIPAKRPILTLLRRQPVLADRYAPGSAPPGRIAILCGPGTESFVTDDVASANLSPALIAQLCVMSLRQSSSKFANAKSLAGEDRAVLTGWSRWLANQPEAIQDYAHSLEPDAERLLAESCMARGKTTEAVYWLGRQVARTDVPDLAAGAAERLAEVLLRENQPHETIRILDEMEARGFRDFGLNSRFCYLRGLACLAVRSYDEAATAHDTLRRRAHANVDPRVYRASFRLGLRIARSRGFIRGLAGLAATVPLDCWRIANSPLFTERWTRFRALRKFRRRSQIRLSPRTLDREDCRRIAVVRLDRLGDLVCMLPALRLIRESFPQARIECFVTAGLESIVALSGSADSVHPVHWKNRRALERVLSEHRGQPFDLLIDLQYDEKPKSLQLTFGLPARNKLGYDTTLRRHGFNLRMPSPRRRMHIVRQAIHLLQGIDVRPSEGFPLEPRLRPEPDQLLPAPAALCEIEGLGPLVGVHPGSGWKYKQWYPERFAAVADRLVDERAARIVILGGPGEESLAACVRDAMARPARIVAGLDLATLISTLTRLDLLVANDSGPCHLAAALGIPVVAAWGPGDFELFGPLESSCKAIAHRPLCANCPQEGSAPRCPMGYRYEEVPCLVAIQSGEMTDAALRTLVQPVQPSRPRPAVRA